MMTKEEQKSGPSNGSCSPKPLDTTTQESSRSENLEPLIDNMYFLSLEGKKINNKDLFDVLGEVFSKITKIPSQIVSLQEEYAKILQEKNMEVARENTFKFVDKLLNLGADDRVCNIILKQHGFHFLLSEYYNVTKTGKLLEEDDLKVVLSTILRVSDEKVNMYYQRYQRILKEEDMGVARENAVKFIGDMRDLGADEKVCTIFLKQFGLCFLFNECYNAANTGKCLKDDDVKAVLNMMPRISDEQGYELYRSYQQILQAKNMEFARRCAINFFDDLSKLGADEKVLAIIFNQFEFRFDFLEKYYNSRQVADAESIRRLLNKIPGVSSESIDKLCEEYENIINKKDRNGAVHFIYELSSMGVEESICDIIQIEFCKIGIILPAEVRPSISGNLFVPEDAKYKKRYEYGGKFISELCFGNGNPANRPLDEELVEYFREEVINPYKECKRYLPVYIEQQLKDKKHSPKPGEELEEDLPDYMVPIVIAMLGEIPFFKPREKLERMLDVLTSKQIDDAFKKSLEIVKRFSKELVSEGNRKNDRKLKETAPNSSSYSIRSRLFAELKSQLPSEEDFMLIRECIAMLYELKGRKPASQGQKRSTFTRTPFYDGKSFTDKLHGLVHTLALSKESLFPHDPCLDDIKQTRMGDCYLLASIASLLNSYGPDFIRNMMIDNGDGTVTVRLYAQNRTDFDEGKSHVKYVKVYKYGLISSPRAALWVQIIEKAYISLGANLYEERKKGKLEGIEVDYKNKDDRKKYPRTVEDLRSGHANNALRVLADIKCDEFFNSNFDEEKIKSAISKKLPVVCGFKSDFSCNGFDFLGMHAYSIIGAEERDGETILKLANPHNAGLVYKLPFKELKKYILWCTIADTDSQTEGMGS